MEDDERHSLLFDDKISESSSGCPSWSRSENEHLITDSDNEPTLWELEGSPSADPFASYSDPDDEILFGDEEGSSLSWYDGNKESYQQNGTR